VLLKCSSVSITWDIYVDDMLTWSHQIDIIYSKLLKYIGIFYKIRNKLPMVIFKKIFTLHLYIRIFCTALKSMEILAMSI